MISVYLLAEHDLVDNALQVFLTAGARAFGGTHFCSECSQFFQGSLAGTDLSTDADLVGSAAFLDERIDTAAWQT